MKTILLIVVTALFGSLVTATDMRGAETKQAAPSAEVEATKPVKKVYKKTESHMFSGSRLKGQLKKPDLSYIYQRKGLRAEQIVNVPENFDAQINSGAEQL